MNPYSIAVAPRVSRYNDVRNDIMAPSSPDFRRWSRFSRIRLKNFFRGNLTLQNFSTPVFVVAVALIDGEGRVLLQRRRFGSEHGGLWEFPGGKIEPGETPQAAALREIEEELAIGLDPAALVPLTFASDADSPPPPRRACVILLYTCRSWRGEAECRDGEEIRWYAAGELAGLEMPPLDYPLAAVLKNVI
ncbi:MAG TPA: (deoxy)nucleoside triphosphate pyrophosphohydrolase [Novosphingobium sp.]